MSILAENREQQLAERELAISNTRTALRAEREQLNADRAEADRLLAEARAVHLETNRDRNRIKRLAKRFVRRLNHQHAVACRQLDEKSSQFDHERKLLADQIAHFEKTKSEFNVNNTAARDQLSDAWDLVRIQQERAVKNWSETHHHFEEENAILDTRATEVSQYVKMLVDNRARVEAETAGFREEAASLEARIANARLAITELESRRDRTRAELLGTELPAELASIPSANDLEDREQVLARERVVVASLKASLERESADINDNRRLVAEQLAMLSQARAKWQLVEQQTVIEMEQLARDLNQRESELHIREQQLIRADGRRREEAFDLWQLRLHLETWQTRLTAYEMRWHTEREGMEADFNCRLSIVIRRETELEGQIATWEKARANERERLRAELELWTDERQRLTNAADDFHRQRLKLLDEMAQHAARALAAEELVAGAIQDSGSNRVRRRLTVLRNRWKHVFDRKLREIEQRGDEASRERAIVDDRYRELHSLLMEVIDRQAALNNQESTILHQESEGEAIETAKTEELTALRSEVERLSAMLLEIELPEAPDPPVIEESWAAEDSPTDEILAFDSEAQAA